MYEVELQFIIIISETGVMYNSANTSETAAVCVPELTASGASGDEVGTQGFSKITSRKARNLFSSAIALVTSFRHKR